MAMHRFVKRKTYFPPAKMKGRKPKSIFNSLPDREALVQERKERFPVLGRAAFPAKVLITVDVGVAVDVVHAVGQDSVHAGAAPLRFRVLHFDVLVRVSAPAFQDPFGPAAHDVLDDRRHLANAAVSTDAQGDPEVTHPERSPGGRFLGLCRQEIADHASRHLSFG